MTKSEMFKKAHQMAREIKNEYPEVDYKFQLGLCLTYLQEEGENEMVEVKELVSKAVDTAVEELGADNYKWNIWEKEGKKRIYISLVWYRKGRVSKEVKCGYVDLVENKYIAESKYTKQYDLLNKEYC